MIYLLLAKAEQFSLFDSIVHVDPHVRKDGTFVGQYERHQKVRQHDLFADHPAPEKPKSNPKAKRLIAYVAGKGGPERMGVLLASQPPAIADRLVSGFVAETGLSEFEVRGILGVPAGGAQVVAKEEESPAVAGNQGGAQEVGTPDSPAVATVPSSEQSPELAPSIPDSPTADRLEDVGLLREFGGRWKYKFEMGGSWFTANSKEDAVDRAMKAYLAAPESERLTRAQRDAIANAEFSARNEKMYGGMSIPDLHARRSALAGEIAAHQHAGKREFDGNGRRRTGAAVSNEAARAVGEEKMRLESYIRNRESKQDEGPKEGDTKNIGGIEYRLQDGRWHRTTPEEKPQEAEAAAEDAPAPSGPAIVEHVTKKGKTLRGIIRTDLTKEQAQEVDAYTFRKDGGWFIREKHIETAAALDTAHADGALTPEQHQSAKAANAEGGPAAAKESLKLKVLADKAAKLRQAGQKLADDAAADRNRDRNTNTARRARMAASSEADAAYRESIGRTMMKLADAIEAGEVPALVGVTTRAAIEQLDGAMTAAMQRRDSAETQSYIEQQRRKGRSFEDADLRYIEMPKASWRDGDKSRLIEELGSKKGAPALREKIRYASEMTAEIYAAAGKMIGQKAVDNVVGWWIPAQLKKIGRMERAGIRTQDDLRAAIEQFRAVKAGKVEADPVKLAERAVIGQKVGIDFFPTPKPLAERMARLAAVQPGDKVLEPSAGNGNLADAAKAAGGEVDTVEVSDALRNILQAKGHNLAGRDFDTYEPGAQYDAVIMNPPFSNRQDAAHIMRAWDMVKPGGKLVAIAGEGVFFGSDQKAQAFRDWLDENAADVEKLPEGTFNDKSLLATTSANARLVVLHKPAGPQEGDRKTEDGVEYVLQGGRWHRAVEPVPQVEDVVESAPAVSAVELAEDREDLADEMMRNPHGEKARDLVQKIAQKEAAAAQPDEPVTVAPAVDGVEHAIPAKPKAPRQPRAKDVPDDLDPASPNYRYRDTGYVAGSRKELAAQSIKDAAKSGTRLRVTDVDWSEIEQNPREAKELITKSNLFGSVDWDGLRESGMEPAAGFLIDRIYAAVAPEPSTDGPMGRKDYALGLESLRDRLERCKTPNEVTAVLGEIRGEWEGVMLEAREAEDYKAASEEASALWATAREAKEEQDRQYKLWSDQHNALSILQREQERRERRKWKPDPELDAKVAAQQIVNDAAHEAYMAWVEEHPELKDKQRNHGGGWTSGDNDLEWAARQARDRADAIMATAKSRNLIENPTTRAWATLGPRFHAVMNYRRYKGSKTFAEHVAAAKTGVIKDWSWAEKDGAQTAPRANKRAESFHLRVAESFERQGGRPVSVESTQALKDVYGLRDVQSGNWVLNDPTSAAFHVQRSAEAFADLADLLGVEDSKVSMNGRLAMAFGARGKGNAGWKGSAAATYEPVHRVINLTKMGGGGALGHEWWHAIDNLAKEAEGGGESGKEDFASENPSILPAGELRDAFTELHRVMTEGNHKAGVMFPYTARDYRLAKDNIDHYAPNEVAKRIKAAKDAEGAVKAVEDHFSPLLARRNDQKMQKLAKQWTTLAVAYHDGNPDGAEAVVRSGQPMSSFALEALRLDEGQMFRNWSSRSEMSARAFQSWIEDRLAEKGRRNDYLSVYADNKYHVDPILGPQYPYPDGEERARINAAFDRLVGVLRERNTLAKAQTLLSEI